MPVLHYFLIFLLNKKPDTFNKNLEAISKHIAKHLKINKYKKMELTTDLKTAGLNITAEEFKAYGLLKSGLLLVAAFIFLFIFENPCRIESVFLS